MSNFLHTPARRRANGLGDRVEVENRMPKLDPWLVDLMQRFAEGIVSVIGSHCEIVMLDFSDPANAIVVKAGDVTGRDRGGPLPDPRYLSQLHPGLQDQTNYRTHIGDKMIQTSSVWIRDADGKIIGEAGINVDYSKLTQVRALIDDLTAPTQQVAESAVGNTFARDASDLIRIFVEEYLQSIGVADAALLDTEQKRTLVAELDAHNLFHIRGAANQVAELLDVSRATVYHYRAAADEAAA